MFHFYYIISVYISIIPTQYDASCIYLYGYIVYGASAKSAAVHYIQYRYISG